MLYYQGFKGSDNRIIGGGNHEAGNKHEIYNFLPEGGYEKYGYRCAVCGFDFYETYGEIGKNFIHIHHLKPLADLGGEQEVAVDDLRPVCPNCHAMLHRKKKGVYSISAIFERDRLGWF